MSNCLASSRKCSQGKINRIKFFSASSMALTLPNCWSSHQKLPQWVQQLLRCPSSFSWLPVSEEENGSWVKTFHYWFCLRETLPNAKSCPSSMPTHQHSTHKCQQSTAHVWNDLECHQFKMQNESLGLFTFVTLELNNVITTNF